MNRAYGTDKIISRKGGKAPLGVQLGRTRLLVSGNEPFAPTKLHYGLIMYFWSHDRRLDYRDFAREQLSRRVLVPTGQMSHLYIIRVRGVDSAWFGPGGHRHPVIPRGHRSIVVALCLKTQSWLQLN